MKRLEAKQIGLMVTAALALSGCGTLRGFLAGSTPVANGASTPIHNPFGDFYANSKDRSENLILRTKKGDRAVEIELPRDSQGMTDFTIPVSPAFREDGGSRNPASAGGADPEADDSYKKLPPTMADREITRSFPQGPVEQEGERRAVEEGLGLMPSDDVVPDHDQSYLAALDHLKTLYRGSRFEAALVDTDGLIHQYPTDPKLHEMRGTLLDRLGQTDLALKSWNQALRLDPKNSTLRKFIERREQKRSIASPGASK